MRIISDPPGQDETLLSFKGQVTDELLDCLLELVEHKLQNEAAPKLVKKRVFRVLVETLQNVYHHLDILTPAGDDFSVNLYLKKDPKAYTVSAGNHISIDKVDELRSILDQINAMTKSELKTYYRGQLSQGQFSHSGGAGLGLADIVRKSREKITYCFESVNEDYSYFSFQVKILA